MDKKNLEKLSDEELEQVVGGFVSLGASLQADVLIPDAGSDSGASSGTPSN